MQIEDLEQFTKSICQQDAGALNFQPDKRQVSAISNKYGVKQDCIKSMCQCTNGEYILVDALVSQMHPDRFNVTITSVKALFVKPNEIIFIESRKFWTQDKIDMFAFENWDRVDNKPIKEQADDLYKLLNQSKEQFEKLSQVAQKYQNNEKAKAFYEKQLSKSLENLNQLQDECSEFLYQMNNLDENEQNNLYQIDTHYLNFAQAKERVLDKLFRTRIDLRQGKIQCNSGEEGSFIFKVICGFGYGRYNKEIDGLKEKFLVYFQKNFYDFAYIQANGIFLIRIKL